MQFLTKYNRDRNRPMSRLPLKDLEGAIRAYDSVLAESTAIRARAGLDPVADGPSITEGRARLASLQAKASKRRPKGSKTVKAADPLADLAKRRSDHRKAGDKLDREVRELIASKQYKVAEIALAFGLTRQRVYQLAA